jgi:choline-glycine betaine transporter
VVYILVALVMGFVAYRWNLPMTARMAFYPLIGNLVYGSLGDIIDSLSMACTTFGVCTSLGFGVASINSGLHYLNNDIPADDTNWQVRS